MEKTFEGKTALVTGGSFGIGKATAIAFAKHGARVVVADCVDDVDTMDQIAKVGGAGVFVKCDVSSDSDVANLMARIASEFGSLDFAFNNAGIEGHTAPTHQCTIENWDKTMAVNLRGVWFCMKHELELMLPKGKGAIVNNASIAGLVGFQGIPAYVASKHGVIGLTKNAALEYARMGVRVNVVCPGVIRTPMIDRFTGKNKEVEKQFESQEPIGRLGEPEEVANAVIWLCSDASSFVTGVALPVDGGWVAQ